MLYPKSDPIGLRVGNIVPSIFGCVLACLLLPGGLPAATPQWDPVEQSDLADSKPHVDPDAAAEIISREFEMDHRTFNEAVYRQHVRGKIYDQRGIDEFGKVEIPYDDRTKIYDIAARTIKPDGTIVELDPKDIFDREIIKAEYLHEHVKAFAFPGLVPGSLVEYQYSTRSTDFQFYAAFSFQSRVPARLVRYRYRPARLYQDAYVRTIYFKCPPMPPAVKGKDGFYVLELTNLPAFKPEPFQPPDLNTQTSLLIYYSLDKNLDPTIYWNRRGKELFEKQQKSTKATRTIKTTLAAILSAGGDDEAKLRQLYDYCHLHIINRTYFFSRLTPDQLAHLKDNDDNDDTIKRGYGTNSDINTLFAALAQAAGFDARFALCNRRDLIFFDAGTPEAFMTPDPAIAVKVNGRWKFFDPGAAFLPFGMLTWRNEETGGLIAAEDKALPVIVPSGDPSGNIQLRQARLQLDDDGSLAGEVTHTFHGQREIEMKTVLNLLTPDEQEQYFRTELHAAWPEAKMEFFNIGNVDEPAAPLKISYHISIPNFADRTGTRLFFQPAIFQKNAPPLFEAPSRQTDIVFKYPVRSRDEITIHLPDDYGLEEGSAPGDLDFGGLGKYTVSIGLKAKANEIVYVRDFLLAARQISKDFYPAVKKDFAEIQRQDGHTLTLKRIGPETKALAAPDTK